MRISRRHHVAEVPQAVAGTVETGFESLFFVKAEHFGDESENFRLLFRVGLKRINVRLLFSTIGLELKLWLLPLVSFPWLWPSCLKGLYIDKELLRTCDAFSMN